MKTKAWLATALALSLVFGMFGGTVVGASVRSAVVTDVVGDVTVAKAGGALEIPVFVGMTLHEGDRITVGKGGFLHLKTADREDEIVIGENWRGTLSRLRANDRGGTDTAVKTWAGSMYSNVRKMIDSANTFQVETPTADMNVRGTHFLVTIDPRTGLPIMVVNAGKVDVSDTSSGEGTSTTPVLPTQQLILYPGENVEIGLEYIDPEEIVLIVDKPVLAELLKRKRQIDEENDELLNDPANVSDGTLTWTNQELFESYRRNVEYALLHILKAAVAAGKLSPDLIDEIINTANQAIDDLERNYDLDREVPEFDRSTGVDPEEEERRRQQREEAEQKRQEKRQQQNEKREEIRNRDSEILDRIEQRNTEQTRANEQALQEKSMNELTDEQRSALEERLRQRKEAADRQREREPAGPPASPAPSSDPVRPIEPARPSEPADPLATSTTIRLSETSIVYGQTFTMIAEVKTSNETAVPDGGTIEFRIGESVVGSATIADGRASLTVDGEVWRSPAMSGIGTGRQTVSARYAGVPQRYAGSTSPGAELDIAKAEPIVELSVSPEPPVPGDKLDIRVNVTVQAPGGGEPTGMVFLYHWKDNGWQPVGDPLHLAPGTSSVSFEDLFRKDPGAHEIKYKAEFVSTDGKHNDGASPVKAIVIPPSGPVAVVKKVVEEEDRLLEIHIDLADFTVDEAVYGAELRFRHPFDIYTDLEDFTGRYSTDKFGSVHDDDHSFFMQEAYDAEAGRQYWLAVYEFLPSDPNRGMEFSVLENMATLVFRLTDAIDMDDVVFELVYWRFTDSKGETIDVSIQPGAGIAIHPFE